MTIREGTREDLPAFYDIMKVTGERDHFFIRPYTYFENLFDSFTATQKKLYLAEYNGQVISAVLLIFYAQKAWYLYGGSLNVYRNLMPNHLLQWVGIQEAMERNCGYYDFRGMLSCKGEKDSPGYGMYQFKKGFHPELKEFTAERHLIFHPLTNFCYERVYRFYKTVFAKWMKYKKEKNASHCQNKQSEERAATGTPTEGNQTTV